MRFAYSGRCALLLLAGAFGSASSAQAGEQYALLVAVADYPKTEFNPLRYTRDDLIEFRRVLLDSGFRDDHVVLMHDRQTRPEYLPEIKKIRKQLDLLMAVAGRDDTLVVALSGHGVDFAKDKHSYFCPLDGELADKSTLLDLDDLYASLKDCKAQKKLLLVDACRNDPQSKMSKSARPEVDLDSVSRPQNRDVPEGVVALFSCSAGEKSWEPDDLKHGIFFYNLIKGWRGAAADKDGRVTLDGVVAYATSETQTYARVHLEKVQRPQRKNEFSGEWVLNAATGTTTNPETTDSPPMKPGEARLTLKGHDGGVWCATFSHDGKVIASGSLDKTIRIWDTATGKQLHVLEGHTGLVNNVAFGRDDRTLLSVSKADHSVRLWDVASEQALWSRDVTQKALSAAYSPDGSRVVVGAEKALIAYDHDGKMLWLNAADNIDVVAFSPDGNQVAYVERAGNVAVCQAKNGLGVWKNSLPANGWGLAYQPSGQTLAVGLTKSGVVLLFDATDGKRLHEFSAHNKDVSAIDYAPDGKTLATASFEEKGVKLWDAVTFDKKGKVIGFTNRRTLEGHTAMVRAAAFSPDGKHLVSASLDKTVKVWDLDPQK